MMFSRLPSFASSTRRLLPGIRFYAASPLDASKLVVTKTTTPRQKVPKEELKFGHTFSDHMMIVRHDKNGWGVPEIKPYGPLSLDPSSSVFHYGLECFEGMKAYIDADNKIRLFRPTLNMERMNFSMDRLCLPKFSGEQLIALTKELLKIDKEWIPKGEGYSMYIRPTGIATQASLGVGPSTDAMIFIILSPVGPYYPTGFKPVSLKAEATYRRAWPGGTGNAKIGPNYAPTILPQMLAGKEGFSQVLWLMGEEDFITEAGTMNMFIYWKNTDGKNELVTYPLDGTTLPGVTRTSILEMCREWGEFDVSERPVAMHELIAAQKEGRVHECFGSGTAALVSPVKSISYKDTDYAIPLDPKNPDAGAGPLTQRILNDILAIQYGKKSFKDWSVVVD